METDILTTHFLQDFEDESDGAPVDGNVSHGETKPGHGQEPSSESRSSPSNVQVHSNKFTTPPSNVQVQSNKSTTPPSNVQV